MGTFIPYSYAETDPKLPMSFARYSGCWLGYCTLYGSPVGSVDLVIDGYPICRIPGDVPNPILFGTPTPSITGTPSTPTPTVTAVTTLQSPHYYIKSMTGADYRELITYSPVLSADVGTTSFLVPGFWCGGDDEMRAVAFDADYLFTGAKDNAYLRIQGIFGSNIVWGFEPLRAGTGVTVSGHIRQCGWADIGQGNACDRLASMVGVGNEYVQENINASNAFPTNSFRDYWVRTQVETGSVKHYNFQALCYGDEEPIPEPTPTPTPSASGYCGVVEDENNSSGGGMDDVGILPIITVGPSTCLVIGGFTLDLTWISSLGQLAGISLPTVIEMPGLQVCFRAISLGVLGFLGIAIDMDLLIFITSAITAIITIMRS